MGAMKVYCERDCINQENGFCQNEAIAISESGSCCDYEKDLEDKGRSDLSE